MITSLSPLLLSKMAENIETALGSVMSMSAVRMESAVQRKATVLKSIISLRNVVTELDVKSLLITLGPASKLILTPMSAAMLRAAIIIQPRFVAHGMVKTFNAAMTLDSAILRITALTLIFKTSNAVIVLIALLSITLFAKTKLIASKNVIMVLISISMTETTVLTPATGLA